MTTQAPGEPGLTVASPNGAPPVPTDPLLDDAGGSPPPGGPPGAQVAPPVPPAPQEYKFTPDALRDRLSRAQGKAKQELLSALGFKDEGEAKAALEELAEARAKREEERQRQLSREEQLAEQAAAAQARAAVLEATVKSTEERRLFEKQDAMIRSLASKYVDSDFVDAVVAHYGTNIIARMTDQAASSLKKVDVDRWFSEYAKKYPRVAKGGVTPPPPRRTVAASNGEAPNGVPPVAKGASGGRLRLRLWWVMTGSTG